MIYCTTPFKKKLFYTGVRESVSLPGMSDFAIPQTVAHQAPLSMEFSRQEYWSELPFTSAGNLPVSGLNLVSCSRQILYHLSHQVNPILEYSIFMLSDVQQSDVVVHIHTSFFLFFRFFSHVGYYRALGVVLCAI